jgi:ATP-binding protein involved in chromosome partitioning
MVKEIEKEEGAEVVKAWITDFNVDLSCDGQCENCDKYFVCTADQKRDIYGRGRMDIVQKNLAGIKRKMVVVGGKGGVGKTLLTCNLATAFAMLGKKVSILDQVFDGPCVPKMMGVEGRGIMLNEDNLLVPQPTDYLDIQVISMGLILPEDESVTWFHSMKRGATEELLSRVVYGERDYMVVDVPAGTSSDTTNVLQFIPDLYGGVIVTIPSDVSQGVARKAATLFHQAEVDIYGVVENMSGFTCPECGEKNEVLQTGGGEWLADRLGVKFWGKIPLDRRVAESADEGVPFVYKYPDWEPSKMLLRIAEDIDKGIGAS